MSNPFFDHPILNSPYRLPERHWELDAEGQPTQKIIETRRSAEQTMTRTLSRITTNLLLFPSEPRRVSWVSALFPGPTPRTPRRLYPKGEDEYFGRGEGVLER
jgi:hypothetical protein